LSPALDRGRCYQGLGNSPGAGYRPRPLPVPSPPSTARPRLLPTWPSRPPKPVTPTAPSPAPPSPQLCCRVLPWTVRGRRLVPATAL